MTPICSVDFFSGLLIGGVSGGAAAWVVRGGRGRHARTTGDRALRRQGTGPDAGGHVTVQRKRLSEIDLPLDERRRL